MWPPWATLAIACLLLTPSDAGFTTRITQVFPAAGRRISHMYKSILKPLRVCKASIRKEWPSPIAWSTFNIATEYRLLYQRPPALVCDQKSPFYDAGTCYNVQSRWHYFDFHGNDPISNAWQQYNNNSCVPGFNARCTGDGFPVYIINATKPEHVRAAIVFARRNNVRLNVKASGMDYLGRSVSPNSLSIWTRYMNEMSVSEGLQLEGSSHAPLRGKWLKVGAGARLGDVQDFLSRQKLYMIGDGPPAVSLAGLVVNGGYSVLSPKHGLTSDQVAEMEVVTPGGTIVKVNKFQNQDLYWAMRGGGGSTFGVITSMTMRVYPNMPLENFRFSVTANEASDPTIGEAAAYIVSQMPSIGRLGIGGTMKMSASIPLSGTMTPLPYHTSSGLRGEFIMRKDDARDINSEWGPIIEHVQSRWPNLLVVAAVSSLRQQYYEWTRLHAETESAGTNKFIASWFLQGNSMRGNLTKSAEALNHFRKGQSARINLIGRREASYIRDAASLNYENTNINAVGRAFRAAFALATVETFDETFKPLDKIGQDSAMERLNGYMAPLRELNAGMGSYIGEVSTQGLSENGFWGDQTLLDLSKIKRRVDPDDVFWCRSCVQSKRWIEEADGRLCRPYVF